MPLRSSLMGEGGSIEQWMALTGADTETFDALAGSDQSSDRNGAWCELSDEPKKKGAVVRQRRTSRSKCKYSCSGKTAVGDSRKGRTVVL